MASYAVGETLVDEHGADLPPLDTGRDHAVHQVGDRVDRLLRIQLEAVRLHDRAATYALARGCTEVEHLSALDDLLAPLDFDQQALLAQPSDDEAMHAVGHGVVAVELVADPLVVAHSFADGVDDDAHLLLPGCLRAIVNQI